MTQSMEMVDELDDCFLRTAASIIKYYVDKEEQQTILNDLRDTLKNNCALSAKIKSVANIKEQLTLMSESDSTKNVQDIIKEYEKAIAEIKVDPSSDKRLLEFDRQVERLLQTDTDVPSNMQDDADSELRLTGADINVIDPISKLRMTDPVRNAVCGHVYDRESLTAMLSKNKNTRCPVVGCTSIDYIQLSQCRTDIVMKTYLEKNPA